MHFGYETGALHVYGLRVTRQSRNVSLVLRGVHETKTKRPGTDF